MPYTWFVGPADTPSDLAERLLARGLVEDPEGAPGMVARLDGIGDEKPAHDITIEAATNAEAWNVVCDLLVAGFQSPPELGTVLRGFADLGFRDGQSWRAWLVRRGGEPAGTALGVVEGDALGIFNVTTVEAHRRHGVGRAATLSAMRFGAGCGCRIAVLQTSELGRSLYGQLGFEEYGMYRVFLRSA
jgi:GNAT superfamily N-acetyltransferase